MAAQHVLAFRCMGCHMRVLVGEPEQEGLPSPPDAAARVHAWLDDFDARLSRFKPDSELSALNRDPRERVPASPLLRVAVSAGLWAAQRSDGLVDPVVLDAVEAAGYRESRADAQPAPLADALAAAPPRAPARPDPAARWREFSVDDEAGAIQRPPGLRFDAGGVGKGLAADAAAELLSGYSAFAIDCAGDLRIGGPAAPEHPYAIEVDHPLSGGVAHVLHVGAGGVATSALSSRVWRSPDGGFRHHLIDPATGRPAWTGLVSATALAPTTLEAETLAKVALLGGADRARAVLAEHGGVIIGDDGATEAIGPAREHRLTVRFPAR